MSHFLLALGIACVSASAPLIRWAAPISPLAISAGRVALAALILCAISGRQLREITRLPAADRWRIAASGALLAAHFGAWITSLGFTSTAASVALVATQPVFAAALGWFVLGDRLARRELAGIAVAAVGCAVLAVGDAGADALGRRALAGDGLAVLGALTAAAYLIVGRRMRSSVPLLPYLAAVNLVAAALLWLAVAIEAPPLLGFSAGDYAAIAIMAIAGSVVGHTIFNRSVRELPVHLVGLAILAEPIGASLATWAIFSETPPVHAVLGGALVLAGIYAGFARR